MAVIEVKPDGYNYLFNPANKPVAYVDPGDDVYIWTDDAAESRIRTKEDLPGNTLATVHFLNPQTGPIYVNGAKAGDTLAITIKDIEFTRDFAFSAFAEHFGAMSAVPMTMLQAPLKEHTWIWEKVDEKGDYWYEPELDIAIPKRPFLGTFAVAPDGESISSLTPGPFGGNMDCPDICPGNTVYLPCYNDGGLFYTGDGHAAQGDGELCGFALETTTKTHLVFDVIKGKQITNPRIENDQKIMCVGSARPMEDACRMAYYELIHWINEDYGFTLEEAYQLCAQVGRCYVANVVDTLWSMCASIEKKYLKRIGGKPKPGEVNL